MSVPEDLPALAFSRRPARPWSPWATAPARARSPPRLITRIECLCAPALEPDPPVLDVGLIVRAKERRLSLATTAPSPHSTSSESAQTLASSARSSLASAREVVRDSFASETRLRRLRHDYFRVATIDGHPAIPRTYCCPIALCEQPFDRFEHLQAHWTDHPWNRGGILTPVCAGGIRRLGWWEHKRKFFASLAQGFYTPEFPEDDGSAPGPPVRRSRRRPASMDEVCRSDYGDISLFGSRTYYVSPRVVPMRQVAQWELQRDAVAAR
ncbi:hypothetical protein GGF46_000800 [Coemansia sp. RSA 552]|nr:hypothetical protein GGF46_000800 [Coemansia sp. RSA 552]